MCLLNRPVDQLLQKPKYKREHPYASPYKVNGQIYEVPPWCHPATIATRILNEIQHTHYYGLQVIAPPGNGKTTTAKIVAHWLHVKGEKEFGIDFNIRLEWEKYTHAFENLEKYIKTLPKRPTIVIFDDLSGVFGKLTEEQINENFEALTEVRWILDPAEGKIPFIPILTYHYSKVVEKKFRSQNGMSIFCRFGNEERTNLDSIAPKKTQARRAVYNFMEILKTMYVKHRFKLMFDDGRTNTFETDNPFRASLMISDDVGNVIVTSKEDICSKCSVVSNRKKADEYEAVQQLKSKFGTYGTQALRIALANRGVQGAMNPKLQNTLKFIEDRFLPTYAFDHEKLLDAVYKSYKLGRPKKTYRKRKDEKTIMDNLDDISFEDETQTLPKSESST